MYSLYIIITYMISVLKIVYYYLYFKHIRKTQMYSYFFIKNSSKRQVNKCSK